MALRKRDRLQIYASILVAILEEIRRGKEAKLTRVQYRVGVPFDRFKGYVEELKLLDFVENEGNLRLTGKGREFLQRYWGVIDLLDRREEFFGDATPEDLMAAESLSSQS